jgi:hypothetical protein
MQAHGAQREMAFAEVVPDRIHRRTQPKIPESNYFVEIIRADENKLISVPFTPFIARL